MEPTITPSSGAPAPSPAPPTDSQVRTWAMWCHMSALAGFVVPFGSVLGPLIVWQMKKAEFPSIDEHGREAVNFQLSALIYLVAGGVAAFILSFFCIGFLLLPLLAVIPLGSIIFGIVAGVKANDGQMYRYPFTMRLVK
jgi:uncharacterized Tic20 family protein